MNRNWYRFTRTLPAVLSFLVALAVVDSPQLSGQVETISNRFSSVSLQKGQKSGRFWLAAGSDYNFTRYTYKGVGAETTITSNVVFRIDRADQTFWFTNVPNPNGNGGFRPRTSQGEATFRPYDSIYISPNRDTMSVTYIDMAGFDVTMRFVIEEPRFRYDDGSDILIEFDYEPHTFVPGGTTLGIFLMLDQDNGNVTSSHGSDKVSVLTDLGYYPNEDFGAIWNADFDQLPEFYLTGYFRVSDPVSDIFSVHRLRGTSLGGAPLDEPDEFAIGRWQDFAGLSWYINSDVTSKSILDVATAMRWGDLTRSGRIRTAFGTNSLAGNNFFHCRDSNLFAVIRTERVVQQETLNGPYTPDQFDVEMWVTNLQQVGERTPLFRIKEPIRSYPANNGRLTLDNSTPALADLVIPARKTRKVTWRLNVDQQSNDSLAQIEFLYRDTSSVSKPLVPMLDACSPLVNFEGAYKPPPPDDRPPVIQRTGSGRNVTAWWTFRSFDRHPGYDYDTGLDRVEIIQNDGNNFRLITTPDPFDRCDTSETINLRAEVIDTSRDGFIHFEVRDCNGNTRSDSARYSARPDIFKPEISRIDSIDRYDPENYPCAVRVFEVYLEDRNNQGPNAGDLGFGEIEVIRSDNFRPIEINFDRGGVDIADNDPTATFRMTVEDTLTPASATIRYADYVGNEDSILLNYCPLPDTAAPLFQVTPGGGTSASSWTIGGTDERPWDRGLSEVIEISRTNMSLTPWPVLIQSGDPSFSGLIADVVDDAWPASVTLVLRDTYYDTDDPSTHAAHSDTLELAFDGTDDTLAPNISITRDLGVPAGDVVFDVAVNDTHMVAGDLYPYDRGLEDVSWTLTSNMQIRTPITFTDNRRGATFEVEIIDPLAIVDADTVCVTATDSAGNLYSTCRAWPSTPDGKSPRFVGTIAVNRTQLTGTATDDREFDRGLGSVILRNEQNLRPFSLTGLAGAESAAVTLDIVDPFAPVSGELVIEDLFGEETGGPEQSIHTIVLPFELPVTGVSLSAPDLVEGGETFDLPVTIEHDADGGRIRTLQFAITYDGAATFLGTTPGTGVPGFSAVESAGGRLDLVVELDTTASYAAGDELGRVQFIAEEPNAVAEVHFATVTGSSLSNRGESETHYYLVGSDPEPSEITYPAPFMRSNADSMTVVNGDCNRVLDATAGSGKVRILSVQPVPVTEPGSGSVTAYISGPAHGGNDVTIELLNGMGHVVYESTERSAPGVQKVTIPFGQRLGAGLYLLRVRDGADHDSFKIIVQ